jgi:hypothetical protein
MDVDPLVGANALLETFPASVRKWVDALIKDPLQKPGTPAWNEFYHAQIPEELGFRDILPVQIARMHLAVHRLSEEAPARSSSSRLLGQQLLQFFLCVTSDVSHFFYMHPWKFNISVREGSFSVSTTLAELSALLRESPVGECKCFLSSKTLISFFVFFFLNKKKKKKLQLSLKKL